jgi:hypothetical protein
MRKKALMPAVLSGLGKAKRVPSLSVGPVVSPVLGADLRSPWIAGLMQDIPYRGVLGAPG